MKSVILGFLKSISSEMIVSGGRVKEDKLRKREIEEVRKKVEKAWVFIRNVFS